MEAMEDSKTTLENLACNDMRQASFIRALINPRFQFELGIGVNKEGNEAKWQLRFAVYA